MTTIAYFGASDDQSIRIRKFFEDIGLKRPLRPVRLQRMPRLMRPPRFLRPGKSLLRSSKSSSFLNSIIWGLISFCYDVFEKRI
jgi:hypothetical protein